MFNLQEIVIECIDLTGRFRKQSSRGNKYVLVGYNFDANLIIRTPMKNRHSQVNIEGWESSHSELSIAGAAAKTQILDNEKSNNLIDNLLCKK